MNRGAWQATVHGVTKESDTTKATKQQQQQLGRVKGGTPQRNPAQVTI